MLTVTGGRFFDDPFAEVRRLQSQVNRMLEGFGAEPAAVRHPAMNLYVKEDGVLLTAELPGLTEKDIELTVADDALTVSGHTEEATGEEGMSWQRSERRRQRFSRRIELPFRVDADDAKASLEDGILEIELHRPQADRPRQITVNATGGGNG